ncbi:MAG: hypothetical protein AAF404_07140 [Pseudomonadota bacterium]
MSTTKQYIKSFEKPSKVVTGVKRLSLANTVKECLFDLAALRFSQLFITCLLLLTLILPVSGYLFARLLDQVGDNLSRARAISLFLEGQPAEKIAQLTVTLSKYPQIDRAELVPAALRSTVPDSDTTHLVEVLPVAGLSELQFEQLVSQIESLPGAVLVSWSTDTLNRNQQASTYAQALSFGAYTLAVILMILLVWRLIRRNIRISRPTVYMKHQLGATPLQLRRPLVLRGLAVGVMAGIAGYALVLVSDLLLARYVDITIVKFNLPLAPLQIFLYFCCVILVSYVITKMVFRREYSYLYQ